MFDPASWTRLRRRCGELTKAQPSLCVGSRLLNVRFVAYDIVPPGYDFTPHEHSYNELIVVLEGQAVFAGNGKAQYIGTGHTFLFSPQTRHGWRVLDASCVMLVVAFSLEPAVTIPFPESWPICRKLVEDINRFSLELTRATPGDLVVQSSLLLTVISHALANFSLETPVTRPNEQPDLLEEIKQMLARDLSRPLTLPDIAAHTGISVRQLTHKFRQLVAGQTISSYILNERLFHARSLLRETDEKIAEIAARVGIASQGHFFASFRRYFGMTPQEYRVMSKNNEGYR